MLLRFQEYNRNVCEISCQSDCQNTTETYVKYHVNQIARSNKNDKLKHER